MKFAQVSLIQFLTTDLVTIKVKCTSIVQVVVVVVVVRSETGLFWPFLSLRPFVESEREKRKKSLLTKDERHSLRSSSSERPQFSGELGLVRAGQEPAASMTEAFPYVKE